MVLTVSRKRKRDSSFKKGFKRVKMIGRSMRRPRFSKYKSRPNRNMHAFKRWAQSNTVIGGSTSAGLGFAEAFTFNQLPSYTEFDVLYDRYMITTVVLKIQLIQNPDASYYTASTTTVNAANWYPKFWYYPDYDDNTAPSSLDEVKQNARAKHFVLQPNREYKVVVKPAVNIQAYRTSTTTGYAPKWNQWIDIAQTDVPHYGWKYFIDYNDITPQAAQRPSVRIERLFYFKCKDVR